MNHNTNNNIKTDTKLNLTNREIEDALIDIDDVNIDADYDANNISVNKKKLACVDCGATNDFIEEYSKGYIVCKCGCIIDSVVFDMKTDSSDSRNIMPAMFTKELLMQRMSLGTINDVNRISTSKFHTLHAWTDNSDNSNNKNHADSHNIDIDVASDSDNDNDNDINDQGKEIKVSKYYSQACEEMNSNLKEVCIKYNISEIVGDEAKHLLFRMSTNVVCEKEMNKILKSNWYFKIVGLDAACLFISACTNNLPLSINVVLQYYYITEDVLIKSIICVLNILKNDYVMTQLIKHV